MMLFPTLTFGLFFLAVYSLAWLLRGSNEWRKIVLLIASWVFYGWWDVRFVLLLIASGAFNWAVGRMIGAAEGDERRRRLLVALGVAANLSVLAWFKYYGFFLEQAAALLRSLGWERDLVLMQVILPVGISFFTFQGISYIVDVFRRRTAVASLLDMTLLMSFFPHLVAGPIVRAAHLIPQFRAVPQLSRFMVATALLLIVWGLAKKAVIASELAANFVDPVFFDPSAHTSLDLLLAAYGYSVQIYCDFSAYTDMAIGIAALLGYRFPHNFNQPYRAASLQDFWRRWHISLSSWLRDYLYIPLGGSRRGLPRLCFALTATMLLGGLWHGASWNFVIWGAIHGGVLAAERLWRDYRPKGWPELPQALAILLTFHVVTLSWIFFRSATFEGAQAYLAGIAAGNWSGTMLTPLGLVLIVMGMALHFLPAEGTQRLAVRVRGLPAGLVGALTGFAILIVDAMRPEGVAPFIYYQF